MQNENSSSQQETQRLLARELAFEQEMLMERETRIRQIESDVLNVNEIMRELGTLVHDQAEVIGEIFFRLIIIYFNCHTFYFLSSLIFL